MNGIQEVVGSIPIGSTNGLPETPADIAIFIKDFGSGGIQRQRLNLARALGERNHIVDLVVARPIGPLQPSELPRGVRIIRLEEASRLAARINALKASPRAWASTIPSFVFARKPAAAFRYLGSFRHYLEQARPRSVLSGSPNPNLMACLARRASGMKSVLVLSEHNDLSNGHQLNQGSRGRGIRRMSRALYPDARALVAVSDGVARDMAQRLKIDMATIHVIHQPAIGSHTAALAREPTDHPWFEEGGPPVILAAGRFSLQKDFPTLIRAFAKLREERPCRLVILGDARHAEEDARMRQSYMTLAQSLGCDRDMDLPGYVANPFRFMARASVFVLSSRHEGMPNVLAEAMSVGCPVVSTDCPSGPSEILDHGRFGSLVPMGDCEALAKAISLTLDHPHPADALKARADMLSADKSARLYEALLLP